jgi:hypothetical protein
MLRDIFLSIYITGLLFFIIIYYKNRKNLISAYSNTSPDVIKFVICFMIILISLLIWPISMIMSFAHGKK